jgi:glycosyltransferase involved in cell wall biosynthesis
MIANEKLTVAIFISNPKGIYSGGRYFGLILAESLALLGHEVHYVTNRLPVFWDDFNGLDSHIDINVLFDWGKSIEKLPERLDLVIVVPGTSDNSFYDSAMCVAISRNARVCLLNFESENWFNSYAPEKRPASAWADWRKIASASNLIMSIAAEGTKYAQDYYTKVPKGCKFFHCYPPINTVAADSTEGVERGKRVILLARFSGDAHKGGDHIARIISQSLAGYSLSILVGTGVVPEKSKKEIEQLCGKYNINLDWRFKLSDVEKFKLYRQSEFLLFPSLFEGYGYPPMRDMRERYCAGPARECGRI